MKAGLKRRKNFLPTLFLALIFWGILAWLVYTYPPASNLLMLYFYVLLFMALFLSAALLLANSRRGLFIALLAVLFLLLRYHYLANVLNLTLLVGISLILEIYYSQKK